MDKLLHVFRHLAGPRRPWRSGDGYDVRCRVCGRWMRTYGVFTVYGE